MDIEKIAEFLQNMNPLTVEPQLCSKTITPKSSCAKCQEICPVQAITLTGSGPKVEQCISCGLCIGACPNHVFRLDEKQLLDIDPNQTETLILTCPQNSQAFGKGMPNGITKINCIGQLYPELLLYLLTSFSRVIIFYEPQICQECVNCDFSDKFQLHCFSNIFDKSVLQRLLIITDRNKVKDYLDRQKLQPAHNRRSFFKAIFTGSKDITQKIIEYGLKQENANKVKNTKKPLKMHYLKEGLTKQKELDYSETLPFSNLKLNACNFCEVCSKLCPTGALQITQEENTKKLAFLANLCTHCRICSEVCFYKGLTWEGRITIGEFLNNEHRTLGSAQAKACANCQQEFFELDAQKDLCFLCRPLQNLNI